MIKAADMLIARRADTRARADFATWKMMAKLNGASALPAEAQTFLASYKALLEPDAGARGDRSHHQSASTRATTRKWAGSAQRPTSGPMRTSQATDNVTAFKRPPARGPSRQRGPEAKPRLPVALIFACLVVVYVGFRYFLQ